MRTGEDCLIDVRRLRREDKEPIRILLAETGVFTKEEIDIAEELLDVALNDADQEDYTICTAIDEHATVAGYYCVGPTPLTQGTYDLYWIAVKPLFHNRGIGKQLLLHAESLVMSEQGRLLIAETSSKPKYDNTRKFYVNNLYNEVARIKDYYRTGDDLVIYGKYFSQSGGR